MEKKIEKAFFKCLKNEAGPEDLSNYSQILPSERLDFKIHKFQQQQRTIYSGFCLMQNFFLYPKYFFYVYFKISSVV